MHELFAWPIEDGDVQAALEKAYKDGSWGAYHGPNCAGLMADLSEKFSCEYVTLTSSGTIAVELALRGVGVEPGDEVIIAGYDFPGNFRAIEAIGAKPVLLDIDANSCCLCADALQEAIEVEFDSRRVKAIVVSHLHGGLADMKRLIAIVHGNGWKVVEDACQVPGARVQDRPAGAWGDAGVLSFGGSKLLTAGRGGAVVANDPLIHQRIKIFDDRGNQAFPLSELQAAVLRPQLAKLDQRNLVRRDNVSLLLSELEEFQEILTPIRSTLLGEPVYYKVAWKYQPKSGYASRETYTASLREQGLVIDSGFRGFMGRSGNRCRKIGRLTVSRSAAEKVVLLHHPVLLAENEEIRQVANALKRAV